MQAANNILLNINKTRQEIDLKINFFNNLRSCQTWVRATREGLCPSDWAGGGGDQEIGKFTAFLEAP